MHPDQRRLQLLNDLIAQTLDVITQQRNITGGFSHSPYQMTPMQQPFFDPNRQQWSTQPQYGYGTPTPQYSTQMTMGPRVPQPQVYGQPGQPMAPSGFGHSPYQQTMMDPFQLQMLRQQQNLPWQQVPTSVYGQNIPGVFPTTEQQWDPRGFSHTPYQSVDPLTQQREILEWNRQRQISSSPVSGQMGPMFHQQPDPQGFFHSSWESMDPMRRQQGFFQENLTGQYPMNVPLTSMDPNIVR